MKKGNLQEGLSSKEKISESPDALGMGSKGPGQVPKGPAKKKASGKKGSFQFC